jgi:transposase-like protein
MPRRYPPEFRRQVPDRLDARRRVAGVAADLGVTNQSIYIWRRQHLIDTGQMPGITGSDHVELVAAHKRIAELRTAAGFKVVEHHRIIHLPPSRIFNCIKVALRTFVRSCLSLSARA